MGRRSAIRFSVGAFIVLAVSQATNPAFAQNLNDLLRIFGGDNQRATRQARAEWRRLAPAETSCIDQRLRHKGSSVEALIRGGVKPSATRLVQLRSSCREFVQGVQVDSASASAAESPTPAQAATNPTEPRDANVTSLAETPQGSGMASTAQSSSDSDVASSAESPKDSSATLPSQESVEQVAEEQVQRSDLEPKKACQNGE